MSKLITKEAVIATFPAALSEDKKQSALASTTADELVKLYEQNNLVALFVRIEELDERMCDILAYDFKVDWYQWDGTLTTKRNQIKSLFIIHKRKGTIGAVNRSLQDVYPESNAVEWFEYGGNPYHFKINIRDTHSKYDLLVSILRKINYYKSLRSKLEETIFEISERVSPDIFFGSAVNGLCREDWVDTASGLPRIPTIGADVVFAPSCTATNKQTGAAAHAEIHSVPTLGAKVIMAIGILAKGKKTGYDTGAEVISAKQSEVNMFCCIRGKDKTINLPEVSYYGLESTYYERGS